jgi:hypothetical protein
MKTNQLVSRIITTTLATGMVVLAQGCGSGATSASNYLTDITVTSYEQSGDVWASLSAQLNTGNMELMSVTIPVLDPKNKAIEYGTVAIAANLCGSATICAGGGTLTVSVDVSAITKITTSSNLLPNGTALPLGSAADAATIGIPIGSGGAKLYVAMSNGVAVLGVALPFSGLNTVGTYVPGVDIFDVFTIGKITGDVGIFTGSEADETGIALFADLSGVIDTGGTTTAAPVTGAVVHETAKMEERVASVEAPAPITFQEVKPSKGDENSVYYELYRASNRHTKLEAK